VASQHPKVKVSSNAVRGSAQKCRRRLITRER
jgi:hypothetical protein